MTELFDLKKSYPPLSIWQGTSDTVVNPRNADAMLEQWLQAGAVDPLSKRTEKKSWGTRTTWGAKGNNPIASYSIDGIGHGFPVKLTAKSRTLKPGDPFVLAAGVSAPLELMRLWGI